MKTTLVFTATLVATVASFAEVISEKSPDGRNEIRLTTEPVLSYSVFRDGKERVAPTPISLTVDGKGVLGGKVKVAETARVPRTPARSRRQSTRRPRSRITATRRR